MKKFAITLSLLALFVTKSATAAEIIQLSSPDPLTPNSAMVFTASSLPLNLKETENTWTLDGEILSSGKGIIKQTIQTKWAGEISSLQFTAKSGNQSYTTEKIILPAFLDLIWEAQTITPPFYRGKALPTNEATVRGLAVPLYSKDYIKDPVEYVWSRDKGVLLDKGVGFDTTQTLAAWENEPLTLSVSTTLHNQKITKTATILSNKVKNLLYQLSPTTGVNTHKLLNERIIINTPSISLFAVPFGMSTEDRVRNNILYEWSSNNTALDKGQGERHQRITLTRDPKQPEGDILFSLKTQNTKNIMQYGTETFSWSRNGQ